MKEKAQPKTVRRIHCPKCGELQVKIYPWSSYQISMDIGIEICMKCKNSSLKFGVTQ